MRIANVDENIIRQLKNSGILDEMRSLESCEWVILEEIDEIIVGAAGVGGVFHVSGIQINEKFRGKGIGKKLQNELDKEEIPIKLHFSAEVFYLPNLFELKDNPLLTFGHGKYMLVEFPMDQVPNSCHEVFFQLKLAGVTPIIAHPERNKQIQKDLSIVRNFIRGGCVIQVDAGSITGSLGSSSETAALEIIRQGACHLIGSDAHDNNHRNFLLADALEIAKDILGETAIDLVTTNPKFILTGKVFETHIDSPNEKNRSLFSKLRRKMFSY